MISSRSVVCATLMAICLASGSVLAQRAGSIDTISPAAARPGDLVTIRGNGFGAFNVQITVGGVPASVISANGNQVTFRIPSNAPQGPTTVTATNPGGESGSIAFHILEGVLLTGPVSAPAIDATIDLREIGVDPSVIDHHAILTRLDMRIAPDATVGQVNAALTRVQGGIVWMSTHDPTMTVAVPRQPSIDTLQALARTLNDAPGIIFAIIGRTLQPQVLPPSSASLLEEHTLPTRFPAAWNVMALAARDCDTRRVPVIVPDEFMQPKPISHIGFDEQVPFFDYFPGPASGDDTHGWDVTTTLAARFDDKILTGANPLGQCLDIHAVETDHVTMTEVTARIVDRFPAHGRFIVSFSQGFAWECDVITLPSGASSCTASSILQAVPSAYERALYAGYWRQQTHGRWSDFFHAVSGGNNRDEVVGIRYAGISDSRYNSMMTVAKEDDPFFDFITDTSLWQATLDPNLPDLTATPAEVARLRNMILVDGLDAVGGAPNALTVGSTTAGTQFSDLAPSLFSDLHSDLSAVGEGVRVFSAGTAANGTSFSTPQVAGLASYLWLLSDDLRRQQPIEATRRAIVANSRTTNAGLVIDAYATVLSLDAAQLPTPQSAPVRLALLDVDDNGRFDEADVDAFLAHLVDGDGNPLSPAARDYSRFDLNGDGFTGGGGGEAFDLDRVTSKQYGAAIYDGNITQQIEQATIHYNENNLTDIEILCYYAYSAMYTGDTTARASTLAPCAGVTVRITPASTTVSSGGTQQFSATVIGNSDPRVTWTAGGGTISATGLFTAGNTPGVYAVRATSVAAPSAFAEAIVTVQGGTRVALVSRSCGTTALGVSFSNTRTLLEAKNCVPFPPPPYVPPAVAIDNSISAYHYTSNYTEDISSAQIAGNSISQGTLHASAEVDVPAIDASLAPTQPNGVRAVSSGSITLATQDASAYLLVVNGTITTTNCCNTATSVSIDYGGVIAGMTIRFDPFNSASCVDPECTTQRFTVTQLMNGVDANGRALPSRVTLGLGADSGFTTAGVIQNNQRDQQRKGEVTLTFTWQQMR